LLSMTLPTPFLPVLDSSWSCSHCSMCVSVPDCSPLFKLLYHHLSGGSNLCLPMSTRNLGASTLWCLKNKGFHPCYTLDREPQPRELELALTNIRDHIPLAPPGPCTLGKRRIRAPRSPLLAFCPTAQSQPLATSFSFVTSFSRWKLSPVAKPTGSSIFALGLWSNSRAM